MCHREGGETDQLGLMGGGGGGGVGKLIQKWAGILGTGNRWDLGRKEIGIGRESDKWMGIWPERDKNGTGKRWELCRKEIRIGLKRDKDRPGRRRE